MTTRTGYRVWAMVLLLLMAGMLNAQIATKYAFGQSSTVWEPVFGTYATDAMQDEGLAGPYEIGFNFPYAGTNVTQVKISSNGWVNPSGNLTNPYYNNSSGLAALNLLPLLAPLWDDLSLQFGAVQFANYGVAPHRVFFVQWQAAKWNYAGENEFNFMVRMHETGQIDFIYGPHTGTSYNASATLGINLAPGGSGNYYSILPGVPALAFTTTQYNNIASIPDNGTMYIFMLKSTLNFNAAALNLRGPKNPMHSVASEYVITVGNAGTNPIPADAAHVYLRRGEEILASAALPQIMPGSYSEAVLSWAPDTTGLMYLNARVELGNDPDSLNDVTFSYAITAQPYVANEDNLAPAPEVQLSCQPNPWRESVSFAYRTGKSETAQIEVYNLKGQKLRTLRSAARGDGSLVWDGKSDSGHQVPEGLYLVRLQAGEKAITRKLVRLK